MCGGAVAGGGTAADAKDGDDALLGAAGGGSNTCGPAAGDSACRLGDEFPPVDEGGRLIATRLDEDEGKGGGTGGAVSQSATSAIAPADRTSAASVDQKR